MTKEERIPIDKFRLQVRTNSPLESNDLLNITLCSDVDVHTSIQIKFSKPMKYMIGSCSNFESFPSFIISKSRILVWTFFRSSDVISVCCNGIGVIDFQLSNKTCTNKEFGRNWKEQWSNKVVAIKFPKSDNASYLFRETGQFVN